MQLSTDSENKYIALMEQNRVRYLHNFSCLMKLSIGVGNV